MKKLSLIIFTVLMPVVAFAQEAAQDWGDKILAWADYIPTDGALIGGIAVVLEVVLRLFKSEKPRSIMILVSKILSGLGIMFSRAADLLDKVVPQRIEPPKE